VAPGVAVYYPENFNTRLERRFWEAWHHDPPAYVVMGNFVPSSNAVLFRKDSLESWLSSGYDEVWQCQDPRITLWTKRK
jgi:hypothetical protein